MFTSRFLILSVAVWATAILTTANADLITIMLEGITDNEAEMEWGGSHDPGIVRRGSSDLELGFERTLGYSDEIDTPQRVGLRYLNINIPAGSTINSAHIQFMADDEPDKTIFTPDNDPEIGTLAPLVASISFYGYLDPVTPANAPPLPSQSITVGSQAIKSTIYTLTDITGGQCAGTCGGGQGPMGGVGPDILNVTEPVHWIDIPTWSTGDVNGDEVADPEDWLAIPGAAGPDQLSPNLASIVQQIVDLPEWAANNAISFLIDPMHLGEDEITEEDLGYARGNRTAVALNCGPSENRCEGFPDLGIVATAPSLTIDFTLPGVITPDLNGDSFVDGLDLGIQLGNWGQNVTPSQGELNGVVPVDGLDLGILLGAWNPPSLTAAANVVVPEPATGIILLIGMVPMLLRRNKMVA
ncbi:MAG: hypothetical protein ABGX16_17940 [Pirellulales bacterium]